MAHGTDTPQRRRQLNAAIRASLRELSIELSLLNHQAGTRVGLHDVDVGLLNLIARHGPLSPTSLARRAGLNPATVTGILDRLEGGRWISRERIPSDRRAVLVLVDRERSPDLARLFAGMNASMREICAAYDDAELGRIAEFLDRTVEASRTAAGKLAGT